MLTRILAGALALACILVVTSSAEARHRHYHHRYHHRAVQPIACQITSGGGGWLLGEACAKRFDRARKLNAGWFAQRTAVQPRSDAGQVVAHPAGCPSRAFCGCGAAVRIFGAPIRSLWLAANWFRFPRAAPAPGMAAVRSHHVFAIERVLSDGRVLAYDANSGRGLTRIHVVSLRGYVVVNPRGG